MTLLSRTFFSRSNTSCNGVTFNILSQKWHCSLFSSHPFSPSVRGLYFISAVLSRVHIRPSFTLHVQSSDIPCSTCSWLASFLYSSRKWVLMLRRKSVWWICLKLKWTTIRPRNQRCLLSDFERFEFSNRGHHPVHLWLGCPSLVISESLFYQTPCSGIYVIKFKACLLTVVSAKLLRIISPWWGHPHLCLMLKSRAALIARYSILARTACRSWSCIHRYGLTQLWSAIDVLSVPTRVS